MTRFRVRVPVAPTLRGHSSMVEHEVSSNLVVAVSVLVNAKVQEGDKPAETPQELIAELDRVSTELLDLIKRINRTNSNSATAFAGRGTISDALAERDVLALQRAAYAELAQTAAISPGR